jgi:hypothetical protein
VRIKTSAEDAGWTIREAAWDVEERLLWRGSDASKIAFRRAMQAVEPLQRLIQTRLAWPLSDAVRRHGVAARTAAATGAVVVAAVAGTAGALISAPDGPSGGKTHESALASAPAGVAAGLEQTLSGVAPDFKQTANETTVAAKAVPPAAEAADVPSAPPAQVAFRFAEAFVKYEVGKVGDKTATTFAEVADDPLAKALSAEPPRLPEGTEVPEARVLNVVLGERDGKELEASISLVRLQAASELRLTLRETPEGWQVAEVRG